MSSESDKVPGIRKNGPAPEIETVVTPDREEFMALDDTQQRAMLEAELTRWKLNGLDVGQVPHNIFNMDAMLIALVRAITVELGVAEDALNRHYRAVVHEKLISIRKDAMQSKIIRP